MRILRGERRAKTSCIVSRDAVSAISVLSCTSRLKDSLVKSRKKQSDEGAVAPLKNSRQLGCVFQDIEPPKSILWKGTDMPKPIQRVKFTKAIARHTKIRDQNPSTHTVQFSKKPLRHIKIREDNGPPLGVVQRTSAPRTLPNWRLGLRKRNRRMAKGVLKLKERDEATFFSPIECLPAPSVIKEARRNKRRQKI